MKHIHYYFQQLLLMNKEIDLDKIKSIFYTTPSEVIDKIYHLEKKKINDYLKLNPIGKIAIYRGTVIHLN